MRIAVVGFEYPKHSYVRSVVRKLAQKSPKTTILGFEDGHAGTWAIKAAKEFQLPYELVPLSESLVQKSDFMIIFWDFCQQTTDLKSLMDQGGKPTKELHW